MKQLEIERLLEKMKKYEDDEWSKKDYIHMFKYIVRMSVINERSNIRMAYLEGIGKGTSSTLKHETLDLEEEIEKYMNSNFEN